MIVLVEVWEGVKRLFVVASWMVGREYGRIRQAVFTGGESGSGDLRAD